MSSLAGGGVMPAGRCSLVRGRDRRRAATGGVRAETEPDEHLPAGMTPPPASDDILLARHGETDDNREPIRVQGFTDTPLNDVGRRQAAELGERVADEGIASLWSSDLVDRRRAGLPSSISSTSACCRRLGLCPW